MKPLVLALGALLLLVALGRQAAAQSVMSFRPPTYFGWGYAVPACPAYPAFGYPAGVYYPYPLPPAPSLGFGRGGIYGHAFVGRDDTVTSYTFPGRYDQ